jgi:uncharacterized membrane protein
MSLLLFIHILAAGFWLGCVAVEVVLERSRGGRDVAKKRLVADYHATVDQWIEIPTFIVLLVTGVMLIDVERLAGWYLLKVICGTSVVALNAWCAVMVRQRRRLADDEHFFPAYRSVSRRIDLTGYLGIPLAVAAVCLGFAF